jgi:hypothetical protein
MSDWSSNRKQAQSLPHENIEEKIKLVNDALRKFSLDDDLQDDLKLPVVIKALNHWTGKSRLPAEEAELLEENRRVMYVFKNLKIIQAVCRTAGISVPFDHFLNGKPQLSDAAIASSFGVSRPKFPEKAVIAKSQATGKESKGENASTPPRNDNNRNNNKKFNPYLHASIAFIAVVTLVIILYILLF